MLAAGLAESRGESRRLIRGGGVYWKPEGGDERKVTDETEALPGPVNGILRAGKRRVVRIVES
jgi:tyrosyl-tRNA synthetase